MVVGPDRHDPPCHCGPNVNVELSFPLLDDLALIPAEQAKMMQMKCAVNEIGPAVEYEYLTLHSRSRLPPLNRLSTSPLAAQVSGTIRSPFLPLTETDIRAREVEIVRIPLDRQLPGWMAYLRRLSDAGVVAGFKDQTAKGLVGAMAELISNIFDHSERAETAVAGYRCGDGVLELVVADAGIGILSSLRSNARYSHLKGHGEALEVAVSSGETRFPEGSGHGTGFDTVFRNIAAFSGTLRFRTGDHSLEITGRSLTLAHAALRQRVPYHGFFVSISCRP